MQELIKIREVNGKKAVSARELHLYLEIETRFDTWINRMLEYGFIENIDCSKLSVENQLVDWVLTLDCAKHWAMMQRTPQGMEARNYFIECEKQLKQISIPDFNNPAIAARAWADEYEKRQLAEKQIIELIRDNKELAPKAEVFEKISNSDNLLTLNDAAKSFGIGRNTLMKVLREKAILRKNNTPYQKYIDSGYFVVKVKPIKIGGSDTNYVQTFVTGKGLTWLAEFNKQEF